MRRSAPPPSPRSSRPRTGCVSRAAARRARPRSRARRRSRSTAASRPGRRTVRDPTRWSYCSNTHVFGSSFTGSTGAGSTSRAVLRDVVARALVGEECSGDRADHLVVDERAQLAVVGDLADHRARQLPALADGAHLVDALGRDDRDHPLLRLGDHDLPRLEVVLAQRHAVEVHVDAHRRAPSRRATTRARRRRSPAARARARARRARATPRSAPCRGTDRRSGPTVASRPSPRDPGRRAPTRRRSRRGR